MLYQIRVQWVYIEWFISNGVENMASDQGLDKNFITMRWNEIGLLPCDLSVLRSRLSCSTRTNRESGLNPKIVKVLQEEMLPRMSYSVWAYRCVMDGHLTVHAVQTSGPHIRYIYMNRDIGKNPALWLANGLGQRHTHVFRGEDIQV